MTTPILTEPEWYAVALVAEGAAHAATDDLNDGENALAWTDWRPACDLAARMARAVAEHPAEFVQWYSAHQPKETDR